MSQADNHSKEIEGHVYKVFMLDPLVASDLLADIGHVLAPTLGALGGVLAKEKGDGLEKLLDGAEPGEGESNIDAAIERAVLGFFERFDKTRQRALIDTLAKVTVVVLPDGKEPQLNAVFSVHFRGRLKAMYLWLAFALKVQFESFFSGTDSAIARAVQRVARAASQSPTT